MRLLKPILTRLFHRKAPPLPVDGYRVYTREFDTIVTGEALSRQLAMEDASIRTAVEDAWTIFLEGLQGWRTRNQVKALDLSATIRAKTNDTQRADTVVTFLVDHSGSMRGQKILMASAAVDVAQDFLGQLKCRTEILGFTTQSWKGGKARQRWISRGRLPHPGRLCDLLHIIYKTAGDDRTSTGNHMLKPMLWPSLLKENVDGEAVLWATARLRGRPESHKILVIISDGAPVDDSTLHENTPDYLADHLRKVVTDIVQAGDIGFAAIGVGTDVGRQYPEALYVHSPEDLGEALIGLLSNTLEKAYNLDNRPSRESGLVRHPN